MVTNLYQLQFSLSSPNKPTISMCFDVNTGVDEINDGTKSLEDNMRIDYITNHLYYVHSAIQ